MNSGDAIQSRVYSVSTSTPAWSFRELAGRKRGAGEKSETSTTGSEGGMGARHQRPGMIVECTPLMGSPQGGGQTIPPASSRRRLWLEHELSPLFLEGVTCTKGVRAGVRWAGHGARRATRRLATRRSTAAGHHRRGRWSPAQAEPTELATPACHQRRVRVTNRRGPQIACRLSLGMTYQAPAIHACLRMWVRIRFSARSSISHARRRAPLFRPRPASGAAETAWHAATAVLPCTGRMQHPGGAPW